MCWVTFEGVTLEMIVEVSCFVCQLKSFFYLTNDFLPSFISITNVHSPFKSVMLSSCGYLRSSLMKPAQFCVRCPRDSHIPHWGTVDVHYAYLSRHAPLASTYIFESSIKVYGDVGKKIKWNVGTGSCPIPRPYAHVDSVFVGLSRILFLALGILCLVVCPC